MERIYIRIDSEVKKKFMLKTQNEFGSATRCLLKFIEAYNQDTFYANEQAVGMCYMALQSLHSYTNNINQITKKLHSIGSLDPMFTPEYLASFRDENIRFIKAFRDVVTIDTLRMYELMNE